MTSTLLTLRGKTVIVLCGPSLSGKSAIAQWLLKEIPIQASKTSLTNADGVLTLGSPPVVRVLSSDTYRRKLILGDGYSAEQYATDELIHRYHPTMKLHDEAAFDALFKDLERFMTFPCQSDYIIIDSTGLSLLFQERVVQMCEEQEYYVELWMFLMNQGQKASYMKPLDAYARAQKLSGGEKQFIAKRMEKQVQTLMNQGYRQLQAGQNSKQYPYFHRTVRLSLDQQQQYTLQLEDWHLYQKNRLDSKRQYFVVGDIHECIDEFQALLIKAGFVIDSTTQIVKRGVKMSANTDIILVGDLLDKGRATERTLQFFYNNVCQVHAPVGIDLPKWYIVRGNHEEFLYAHLYQKIDDLPAKTQQMLKDYFTSFDVLQSNVVAREQFLALYKVMYPYLHYVPSSIVDGGRAFFVTHAPCEPKYLGKLTKHGIKAQQYLYVPRGQVPDDEASKARTTMLQKMFAPPPSQQASAFALQWPLHLSGHVALTQVFGAVPATNQSDHQHHYRVMLDTGCAYGGQLSGAWLGTASRLTIVQIPRGGESIATNEEEDLEIEAPLENSTATSVVEEMKSISMNDECLIDPLDFVHAMAAVVDDEVEFQQFSEFQRKRLEECAKHRVNFISFTMSPAAADLKRGELESLYQGLKYYRGQQVILQKKHMGSHDTVYLYRGAPDQCYSTSRNAGIISNLVLEGVSFWNTLLARYEPLMQQLNAQLLILDGELLPWATLGEGLIRNTFMPVGVAIENELNLLEQLGITEWQQQERLEPKKSIPGYHRFLDFNIPQHRAWQQTYDQQVKLYGQSGKVHYEAFSLLKWVTPEGVEKFPTDIGWTEVECYHAVMKNDSVADVDYMVLELSDKSFDADVTRAYAFFNQLISNTEYPEEGIVVKPAIVRQGSAPCLKVRNEAYLSIIYGYDLLDQDKYKKLMKKKQISRKLALSKQEYRLGQELLHIPHAEIEKHTERYQRLITSLLYLEEHVLPQLDSRL